MEGLKKKLIDRTARVGVIGLGYVGLPLAVSLGEKGFHVTGFELDPGKVAKLRAGHSYIIDVPTAKVAALIASGHLEATTDMSLLAGMDVMDICVPTPLGKTRDPDISYIQSALDAIAPRMHDGVLVVLESTTYPGTTDEVIVPRLVDGGRVVGRDFFVAFSPERVDPGNPVYQTVNIPKVVGGVTPACTDVATTLYRQFMERVIPVSSARVAETVKLLENTFRSVNIGLVNEIALMCSAMDIDVWEVIEGASTKPFGFMPFYPGPGLGGHCIPIDPFYLAWKAKQAGSEARFIELAGQINNYMPHHVANLVARALNIQSKPVRGSRILVVGVAYKAGIDDVRESPALDIIELLHHDGGLVSWYDPFVPGLPDAVKAVKLDAFTADDLRGFDVAVIVTNHRGVDHDLLVSSCGAVVDTRNALKGRKADNLFRL